MSDEQVKTDVENAVSDALGGKKKSPVIVFGGDETDHKTIEHIIKVQKDGQSEEGKDLSQRVSTLENVAVSIAQRELEAEKSKLAEQLPDLADEISQISPSELPYYQGILEGKKSAEQKRAPSGKIDLAHNQGSSGNKAGEYSDAQTMINEIYDKVEKETWLKEHNSPYDQQGLAEAEQKADKLLKNSIIGMRLRRGLTPIPPTGFCANCGKILTEPFDECPYCGAKHGARPQDTRKLGSEWRGIT